MKPKNTIYFTVLFLLFNSSMLLAQGEANNWYFGDKAGITFNGGTATALANGALTTTEGCATISDASGALLFYTDGILVWDKNHTIMPNGTGLKGDPSSTQSGVIVPKPGSTSIYYLFTSPSTAGADGIMYSEVDMTLNGGLGDVNINKNISLYTPSCEKITAARHSNNTDIWVITHDWNSNTFRVFLVTSAGVNTTPVLSSIGLVASVLTGNAIGYLKASPNGSKLASAIWGSSVNRFELFDFNTTTGAVTNDILLPQFTATSGAYGVEFSPDGTKLYCAIITPAEIYQFDLLAGSASAIQSSWKLIGTSATGFNGSLQLAPDRKIYLVQYGASHLGVIDSPDSMGLLCNYIDIGIALAAGTQGHLGLPNFIPSFFSTPIPLVPEVVELLIPNVFTPNSDGINDLYKIVSKGYTEYNLQIFNRWGNLVFQSTDATLHWNGKIINTSKDAADGTYYYVLTLLDNKEEKIHKEGFLTLIR